MVSTFSERLKELRMEKGLSQSALSRLVGISSATISRWEDGSMDITGSNIIILSKFFGVTAGYLLGIED